MSHLTPAQPLLLGGFMGAGKSTVGPLVAAKAGVPFLDLDTLVEHAAGMSIETLFATQGEVAFRNLEAATLRSLLASSEPRVIALGGGSLVNPTLRDEALRHAHIVNLIAQPNTLAERVQASRRPLLANAPNPRERIQELLASRTRTYADAHALVRTDHRLPNDIADAVLDAWRDRTLLVRTSSATYPARICHDLPAALVEFVHTAAPSSTFLVTDENVDPLYSQAIVDRLATTGIPFQGKVVLTPGEVHKQWPAVQQILEALIAANADRNSLVIALGGGVVSDVTGFAAAILLRGVRWVALPTTLLSMVDAAVGGKTAVDLGAAKNSVGAFHQPSSVLIDPSYTRSEAARAYISGLAEVIKSGAIADPELVTYMHLHLAAVLERDASAVNELVHRSLRIKCDIVSRDERESGERMLLNFGHTVGHALEAAGNFTRLTHGEAVALGMVAILRFGVAQGTTSPSAAQTLQDLLAKVGLPTNLDANLLEEALDLLAFDKKRVGANLRLVLLEDVGRPRIEAWPLDVVRAYFRSHKTKIKE